MLRRTVVSMVCAFLVTSNSLLIAQQEDRTKIIVSLKPSLDVRQARDRWATGGEPMALEALQKRIKSLQGHVLDSLDTTEFTLRYQFDNQPAFSGEATADGLVKLLSNPSVTLVEPVAEHTFDTCQGIELMRGLPYRSIFDGRGVAVAVVDTGLDYTHPELGGGPVISSDCFLGNGKVIGGCDLGCGDIDPMPDTEDLSEFHFDARLHGHGTCIAGIVAGQGISSDTEDYIGGVAPAGRIYALKILDPNGQAFGDTAAAAWDWCVSHQYDDPNHPILAINYSAGDNDTYYDQACDCRPTIEDFERGNFLNFLWIRSGFGAWNICSEVAHSGLYSARAGAIRNEQYCCIQAIVDCDKGDIRFWITTALPRLSSLTFYVDDRNVDVWSDKSDWTSHVYPVSEGVHIFTWLLVNAGEEFVDEVWIDDIEFPIHEGGVRSAFATAADNAASAGITIVASSGNGGICQGIQRPACIENVLSVGAVYDADIGQIMANVDARACERLYGFCLDSVTEADVVPCWSNSAVNLDLLAPSARAFTTDIQGLAGYSEGDYFERFGGTSAASAYVTGAVACLQSAAKASLNRYLTPQEVRDILTSTGDPVMDAKSGIEIPRVNLERAIEWVLVQAGT